MNEQTKKILSAIGNLPAGEKLFRTSKTTPRHTELPLTTDDLHQLREYVERVEEMLQNVDTITLLDADDDEIQVYRSLSIPGKWGVTGNTKTFFDSASEAYESLKEQQSDD